jgi:hypothetical protein
MGLVHALINGRQRDHWVAHTFGRPILYSLLQINSPINSSLCELHFIEVMASSWILILLGLRSSFHLWFCDWYAPQPMVEVIINNPDSRWYVFLSRFISIQFLQLKFPHFIYGILAQFERLHLVDFYSGCGALLCLG